MRYRPIDVLAIYTSVIMVLFAFVLTILLPFSAYAEEAIPAVPDLTEFWSAITSENWPLAVGLGLMVFVWVFRSFVIKRIPPKALPWAAMGVAVLGTTGTRIVQAVTDSTPWWQGMVQGILEGVMLGFVSMGIWDVKQTMGNCKTD